MFNRLSFVFLGVSLVSSACAQSMTLDSSMFPGFMVVMVSSFVSFSLSIIGALYVIYRTLMRWKMNNYEQLVITTRFPFYLAVTDFLICTINLANVASTYVNHTPLAGGICTLIGAASLWLGALNLGLVGTLALATYARVCKRITFEFGRFDYKLFSIMFFIATIMVTISAREFGQTLWWCGPRPHNMVTPITLITIITIIVLLIAFSYFNILFVIRQVTRRLVGLKKEQQGPLRYETKVTRKIASYLLIFLIQWGSNLICQYLQLVGFRSYWIDAFEVIGICFGGVGNALQYIANEGWSKNQRSTKPASSKGDTGVTDPSEKNVEITIVVQEDREKWSVGTDTFKNSSASE